MLRLSTVSAFFLMAAAGFAQSPCDQLKLSFPDATVTSVQFIPAGPFKAPAPQMAPVPAPESDAEVGSGGAGRGAVRPPAPQGGGSAPLPVPAYCRVMLILTPSSDSKIEAAVFLPAGDWNGKLQVVRQRRMGGNRQLCGHGCRLARRLCYGFQ